MPDDLRKLGEWFTESDWPTMSCPNCGLGFLTVRKTTKVNSAASDRADNDPEWEPEWIFGHFYGELRCSRATCWEPVIVSGAHKVDADLDDKGHWYGEYANFLRLRYAIPALRIMSVPEGTPQVVRDAIVAASRILWTDPSSAGSRLRLAIEDLLTEYGMRRFVNTKGRRVRLSTHVRIQEFKKHESLPGETLEAVKWIGNQGTHGQELTVNDVLDGAGLLEYALKLLYDTSDDEVAKLVRKINKSKGIPRTRRQ